MATLGLLHEADIPVDRYPHPPKANAIRSLQGAVFVGDASLAPSTWQMALLDWLKHGRVTPVGETHLIPSKRCMDVWVMVASSSYDHPDVSPELKEGLERAWPVVVPSLKVRRGDVIIHAARITSDHPPEKVFQPDALQLLLRTDARLGFQETTEVLRVLARSSVSPYRMDEVVEAFARKGLCLVERDSTPRDRIKRRLPARDLRRQ
jgi:hypothetical protein